ncbi:MAG: [NiFe]-hydrogenase assembly chaperone HybE, partial [Pseudomonadota bacterium]
VSPGSHEVVPSQSRDITLASREQALVNAYREAERTIVGLPVHNSALDIAAIGFRPFDDLYVGVIVTPWCMNIVGMPTDPRSPARGPVGSKHARVFPSGEYTFVIGLMEGVGWIETCSLFSPMDDFAEQSVAVDVATSAAEGLFEFDEVEREAASKPVSRRFMFTRNGEAVSG